MDPMTLAVAGVAAAAIFLIAIGIATSGGGSAVSTRLERYASAKDAQPRPPAAAGSRELIASSVALASNSTGSSSSATSGRTSPATSPAPT